MQFINVIEPKRASDLGQFIQRLERVEKFRGRVIANAEEMVCNPHNFGAMMVQYGQADGLVAGNASLPAGIFRSVSNFIKPVPGVPSLFGVAVIHAPHLSHVGSEGLLFLADCGVNPEPSVEQLASFGIETGKLATHFIDKSPKVAYLSHSTMGSMASKSAQKMAAAAALADAAVKKDSLGMRIRGELQADVALDPVAAEIKINRQDSSTSDVLIFPGLDSAHISYNLLKHVGGAQSYGQLILGLSKPAAQVAKTATVESLIGTAALVGVEAIKAREIRFEWKGE